MSTDFQRACNFLADNFLDPITPAKENKMLRALLHRIGNMSYDGRLDGSGGKLTTTGLEEHESLKEAVEMAHRLLGGNNVPGNL